MARTFVELADSLVADFDVVDLLTLLADRCVDVMDVAAAGLMLGSPDGQLRVLASSSEAMRVLELFEIQTDEGPCVDCFRTGLPILNHPLVGADERWPQFGPRAREAGFRSVYALPMRLRNQTIGALNMYGTDEGQEMRESDVVTAQALADVATIAILQHRAVADAQVLNGQLSQALNTRIVIEQAKGVVAERANLNMEQAFDRLRTHARNHNLRLTEVSHAIADKSLAVSSLDG